MSRDAAASRYEIPGQLQQLLLDFTVSCLVERPVDLVDFAADYFAQLRQRRQQQTTQQQQQQQQQQQTGGLVAGSAAHGNGHGPESDDSMLTDESDEPSPGTVILFSHTTTSIIYLDINIYSLLWVSLKRSIYVYVFIFFFFLGWIRSYCTTITPL